MNIDHEESPADADPSQRQARIAAAMRLVAEGSTIDEKMMGIVRLGALQAEVETVRSAAHSKVPHMRSAGAEALGRFGLKEDEPLLERLTSDPNSHVRNAACKGLGYGQYADSLGLLMDIAQDEGERREVRTSAIIAAARVVASWDAGAARTRDEAVVLAAGQHLYREGVSRFSDYCRMLGALPCERSRQMLELLAQHAIDSGLPNPRDAWHLINALRRTPLSERGVSLVVKSLDALPGARTEAALALVDHPVEEARAPLERLLSDPSARLVAACVGALSAIGLQPSTAALGRVFERDNETALQAIQYLHGHDGVDIAEQIIARGPAGLRPAALENLARLDIDRGLERAEALAADANARVREAALKLLIRHGDDRENWIQTAARDPVAWVARIAEAVAQPPAARKATALARP